MADLIKKIKIKKQDGTFTDYIPIGADASNVNVDGESVQYKLNKKPYYYNTVADMKADIKLKTGDMAITLGYYEKDDGGGVSYLISNTQGDKEFIELNNNLYAKEIEKNIYRKFKPVLCSQPYLINGNPVGGSTSFSANKMKEIIDINIYNGYEKFTIDIHLLYNNGFYCIQDLNNILEAFTYAKNRGYLITAIKFHYNGTLNANIIQEYEDFICEIVIPKLSSLNFDKVVIFNERYSILSATDSNLTQNIKNVINRIKLLGFEVGISYAGPEQANMSIQNYPDVVELLDFVGINFYPSCGAYGNETTVDDVSNSFNNCNLSLFQNKKIILTESGIRPYPIYFSAPAYWGYDGDLPDYNVTTTFLEGLYNSKWNNIATEYWTWFTPTEIVDSLRKLNNKYKGVI